MNATTVQIRLMILNDAADGFIPKQKKRAFKVSGDITTLLLSAQKLTPQKKSRALLPPCARDDGAENFAFSP